MNSLHLVGRCLERSHGRITTEHFFRLPAMHALGSRVPHGNFTFQVERKLDTSKTAPSTRSAKASKYPRSSVFISGPSS